MKNTKRLSTVLIILSISTLAFAQSIQYKEITIDRDGICSFMIRNEITNESDTPMSEYLSIASFNDVIRFEDAEGNNLPFEVEAEEDHFTFKARLSRALLPGEKTILHVFTRNDSFARPFQDGMRFYYSHMPIRECDLTIKVTLPDNAKILNLEHNSDALTKEGGAYIFKSHLPDNADITCLIDYAVR